MLNFVRAFHVPILTSCFLSRYELDMLAFSGCYYGGGEKEVIELGRIRKRWKTLHVRSLKRVVSLYKLLALGLVADDNQDMWCWISCYISHMLLWLWMAILNHLYSQTQTELSHRIICRTIMQKKQGAMENALLLQRKLGSCCEHLDMGRTHICMWHPVRSTMEMFHWHHWRPYFQTFWLRIHWPQRRNWSHLWNFHRAWQHLIILCALRVMFL